MIPPASSSAALPTRRFPTLAANSELARVLLAFLATAGLFYVNIMPALIDGLIEGLGFSNQQAGFVGSANVYGAALGALGAVFLVKRLPWRGTAVTLLLGLIAADLVSIMLTQPTTLMVLRFLHGCIGGVLVGIGFAVISRTTEADRTFGYLLTVQFGLGGLGLLYLPGLVPEYGTAMLFVSLIAFSVVTLLMLPFLDDYPVKPAAPVVTDGSRGVNFKLLGLALGGFASKMGLASGPMVAALVLGDDRYGLLINIAVIALLGSLLLVVWPAAALDRRPS